MLENAGHDSRYWYEVLRDNFQTTAVQDLQELDEGTLQAIANCAKTKEDIGVMLNFLVSLKLKKETDEQFSVKGTSLNEQLQIFLKKACLKNYFPGKLNIQDVMKVQNETSNQCSDAINVLAFLKRLIMLDNTARDNFDADVKGSKKVTSGLADMLGDSDSDESDDSDDPEDGSSVESTSIHSLDYFLLAYLCCDHILRQAFIQKLFACRLAIPILYPRFSDNCMELLHWPLRSIVPEWRKKDGSLIEKDAASTPCHFVSFCRVGKFERYRKSKLVNEIISDVAHNTFYHWDCPGGNRKRQVSEGMIEGTWYIPRGAESDILPDLTMILNLRGDSLNHETQFDMLSMISSVIVLVVDTSWLEDEKFCKKITGLLKENETLASKETGAKNMQGKENQVILLIDHNATKIEMKKVKSALKKLKKQVGSLWSFLAKVVFTFDDKEKSHKNADDIKTEMRESIKTACNSIQTKPCSYSQVVNKLLESSKFTSIEVDELSPACTKGKRRADTVVKHITGISVNNLREQVPLQGELWQRWSKLLKKSNRPNRQTDDSVAQSQALQGEMREVREEQFALCINPSPLMRSFVEGLAKCCQTIQPGKQNVTDQVVHFFLQWLKLHFDTQSRLTLPDLQSKYQLCWKKLQNEKGKKGDNMNSLQANVKGAEKDLANASFGLEHLLRELGQMYEAVHATQTKISHEVMLDRIKLLPKLVASLVLSGQPLELMDGDAANIPLSWLKAVIDNMKDLVKDKKIFVVSVLGIQSSGKSTLLNTMFGLQFAVSAGRCTRGVYMQLVHVDEKDKLPFDYVCVIDTEGLRATELGFVDHDHDNELATLVIGLGDVTIMNIKGENYSEMKDVIQIAVHAFLRMKMVSTSGKNHHRCVFIHQNVPATSAKEKMKMGCQKLQENLDMMTAEAAEQEKFREICTFNQVIQFDCHQDVWFFPDLWHGDPPMAYANPGYSSQIREVRNKIFSEMAMEQTGFLLFNDLSQRIEDLWKGIMADDFVFSFRNSLEVKAYNGLEKKCQELYILVEEDILKWEKDIAEKRIEACESREHIRNCKADLDVDLATTMVKIYNKLESELVKFCKTNPYSHITIQWQQNKVNYLKFDIEKQKVSTSDGFKESLRIREIELFRNKKKAGHIKELMKQACAIAEGMKTQKKSETIQWSAFESLWSRWIQGQGSQSSSTTTNDKIRNEVLGAIQKRLSSDYKYAIQELETCPIVTSPVQPMYTLISKINPGTIKSEDFSFHTNIITKVRNFFLDMRHNYTLLAIKHITDVVLRDVQNF